MAVVKSCFQRNNRPTSKRKALKDGLLTLFIISRAEEPVECSVRTLYHQFKENIFDETILPMKWKRKPNGHKERLGKQDF